MHPRKAEMATTYVMKVSSNGQVSIPAEARARWMADQVVVVDLGDRVVLRPLPSDPVGALRGKYRSRGPSTVDARKTARAKEAERERRR
jgi:bifunctional DNA-binding transcriptional regulator/antitoxin component of YhaV-PrlF toxin-antitoxin module